MELIESDNTSRKSVTRSCNCYGAVNLTEPILDTNHASNFTDRYVLGDQLGWGKFGIIRACSDKLTGEVLACKSIAKERLVTQDDVRSVKLEIEIMTKLSGHPNVVDLKAVYEEEDYVHLLMELCAGGELFHQIEKHGRFSEHEARTLFKQLMQVVTFCHENGIIHRDLKPENILLVSKSLLSPIKLADFGLATYIRPICLLTGQKLHGTVGSPFYIAPEVLAGGYNQAADVWSAGVILYILLSGMPPFWGKTKSEIFDAVRAADLQFHPFTWHRISEAAKDLIVGMLCLDPSKRFSAADVLAHSWINDLPEEPEELNMTDTASFSLLEVDNYSFSTPSIVRNQDYSFGDESPAIDCSKVENSPAFTCRSSFSSFLIDQSPCSTSGGYSFDGFSSPLSSMPSFTFFSPSTVIDGSINSSLKAKASMIGEGSGLAQLSFSPDPSQPIRHKLSEMEHRTEFRRGGVANGSKISSKRNHTIGLGELDQLDLMASESVIRWASCTHLPSAAALRSSLVC
ncbi:calcium-dependent protein kinase 26-like isoform X1 [Coffea arabica]|uniref:non-specific serine/threonine protein kinase n=1 Tax=Coffea arabica TaxID=13443 RepID=A0A6P6TMC9_COFAR|nr:calcium-dependent protein kinase 26-like isoform X1 [Coffea arabica]